MPATFDGLCDLGRDRLLEAHRQLVLGLCPFLGAGELLAGGAERGLGVVLRRDILVGAAHRDHRPVRPADRLGEGAQLPDAAVVAPDDPEGGSGGLAAPQQPVLEGLDGGKVWPRHPIAESHERERLPRWHPEQGEGRLSPVDLASTKVLFPAARVP